MTIGRCEYCGEYHTNASWCPSRPYPVREPSVSEFIAAEIERLREVAGHYQCEYNLAAKRLAEAERLLRAAVHYVWEYGPGDLRDEIEAFLADQPSDVCAECGEELEEVRPGKYQHVGECKADKGTVP